MERQRGKMTQRGKKSQRRQKGEKRQRGSGFSRVKRREGTESQLKVRHMK
jgi:hypothetical protein